MNDLFIKTMKKLQENRRVERNSKVLKEDKHVDLEGEEKDIVTVIDPDLSTKEFKEKQQEVNDIINNTPEGENVVDTEYVGMKIYTCPLCLSNFYSEVEMEDEAQCPVCFETPDKFVYLGTVEQAANDSDEEAVEQAEQELDNPQPEEETDGEDEYELVDDTEENTDENENDEEEENEEDNKLFASKQLNIKGQLFREATEQLPEVHQKPRTNANKNYKKIDIYLDGKYFYSTKAFPTIKSAIEDCEKEYGNEVKGRKLKGMFADRKNESLLTEGGIYPVDLDDNAAEKFEEKVGEILGGEVSVDSLELIPAKGFGGSGIYWYKADINVSDENIIKQFLNDKTPIAKRLYDNDELIINMYSDIDVVASDDRYESGISFDINGDTEISDEDYNKLDGEADIVGEQIINKLKENEQTLVNLLKDYEVIEDDEDYVEESLKSEDTGTIISDEAPAEVETTETIPEIDIDDLCNSLQNSESINELGSIIIVIPDGEIKDNAKAAFDKCMDEYNFDTNYVANSVTEAIHNTTNKLVSEAKITDYMTQQELDKAIKSNSILKNITNSYKVLDDMIIEITSGVGKSYYKAILDDDGNIELYWINRDGKQLGDPFPLLSENYENKEEAKTQSDVDSTVPDWMFKDWFKTHDSICVKRFGEVKHLVICQVNHDNFDFSTEEGKQLKSNLESSNRYNQWTVLFTNESKPYSINTLPTSGIDNDFSSKWFTPKKEDQIKEIIKQNKNTKVLNNIVLTNGKITESTDIENLNEEKAEGFKYNNKEYTGLDTYTYTFTLDQEDEFEKAKEELAKTGTVTEIFINNGYGLEYKKDRNI